MDVSRRCFLIGMASAFGAATVPDLRARIADAGRPILLAPNLAAKRMFVCEGGHLLLGDQTIKTFPRPTWKDHFIEIGCRTGKDLQIWADSWEIDDIEALVDERYWPSIYEANYDPMPAAYRLLKKLKIGTSLRSKTRTAGRLDFYAGSNHPGSHDLWVEAYDDLSVSLLQASLIELKQPIQLVMLTPTVMKLDGFDHDSSASDE
jgi:hypothetical protein